MNIKWILLLIILTFSCKNEERKIDYTLYSKMDRSEVVENKLRPRKKVTIPFVYNQIYDPFIKKKKGTNKKSNFEKGLNTDLKITVIDTVISNINVTTRNGRNEKFTQAFPVIIENSSAKKNRTIPLHRGCAKIIQEALNKKGEWVEIEHFTKEKIGEFFYEISPYEYVYTKIPIYEGIDTTRFRVGLLLEDTTLYSNVYTSTIQKWMLRK